MARDPRIEELTEFYKQTVNLKNHYRDRLRELREEDAEKFGTLTPRQLPDLFNGLRDCIASLREEILSIAIAIRGEYDFKSDHSLSDRAVETSEISSEADQLITKIKSILEDEQPDREPDEQLDEQPDREPEEVATEE